MNKISDKDKKDWEKFVSNNEKLPNKDLNFKEKKTGTQRSLDLHGYSLDEANKKVKDFIKSSYQEGIKRITVVTGKGLHSTTELDPFVSKDLSILKHSVPDFINSNQELLKVVKSLNEYEIDNSSNGSFDTAPPKYSPGDVETKTA